MVPQLRLGSNQDPRPLKWVYFAPVIYSSLNVLVLRSLHGQPAAATRRQARHGHCQLTTGNATVLLPFPDLKRQWGRGGCFSGSPEVKPLCFYCRGAQVQSLVGELKSHKPHGVAKTHHNKLKKWAKPLTNRQLGHPPQEGLQRPIPNDRHQRDNQ